MIDKIRCEWCLKESIYIDYHDKEWGKPVFDDQILFEFLVLESFQAGLSWITVLKKRENFREAFYNFNADKVSLFNDNEIEKLMANQGIIRNRFKIKAAINNAKCFLAVQKEFGTFSEYLCRFVNYKTINNKIVSIKGLPATSKESDAMSKDMNKRGFKFVGSTICYAYMQAIGLVNDHIDTCSFKY